MVSPTTKISAILLNKYKKSGLETGEPEAHIFGPWSRSRSKKKKEPEPFQQKYTALYWPLEDKKHKEIVHL